MNRLPFLVVFDIDGTLTRSSRVHQAALLEALEGFGFAGIDTNWSRYRHFTDSWIFRENFFRCCGREPEREDFARFEQMFDRIYLKKAETEPIVPLPGAGKCLKELAERGIPVSFATGSMRSPAEHKLKCFADAVPEPVLATASEALTREELVMHAVEQAKVRWACEGFERIVSVGDGVWDIRTARALGIEFLGVARGERRERLLFEGAERIIADFEDGEWRDVLLSD